jgi:hypothetical protein
MKSKIESRQLAYIASLVFFTGMVLSLLFPERAMGDSSVRIDMWVALVSTRGKEVHADLRGMQKDFQRSGLRYSSFKLLQKANLSLVPGQTENMTLPKGEAIITLIKKEEKSVRIKVKAPGSSSEYTMATGGEVYIDAGNQGEDKIFLVVRG